jgi:dual specificity phosphatase 12
MASQPPINTPTCRVAIVGSQRQRVAKVLSLLRDGDVSSSSTTAITHHVAPLSLLSQPPSPSSSSLQPPITLPKGIPSLVEIEYIPCVATFDSYQDERDATIRYLVKLEHHGENGMLVKGRSLAPFFDDAGVISNDGDNGIDGCVENVFPGIAAVAVGCGIDEEGDVQKIASFMETLSSSYAQQLSKPHNAINDKDNTAQMNIVIQCIQPNPEYGTMKLENEAYRNLTEVEKQEAVAKRTIGPGKMAKFVEGVGKTVVGKRWEKELLELERLLNVSTGETGDDVGEEEGVEAEETPVQPSDTREHTPDPERVRYACKRCRTVLFGQDDLEDPPHTQSLHNFRKKGGGSGTSCANHFLSSPLPWMNELDGMEGKLHCHKCQTKVGHFSWTGAQCSCGTWVTPAIMIPLSKVDEMRPVSENVLVGSGAVFVHPSLVGLMGSLATD